MKKQLAVTNNYVYITGWISQTDVLELEELYSTVKQLTMPSFLYDPKNTKLQYPAVPNIFTKPLHVYYIVHKKINYKRFLSLILNMFSL